MKRFSKFRDAALLGAFGLVVSASASATAGYCVAPSPVTTDGLALTDVTFTIGATDYSPVDCYGVTSTADSSIATVLTDVNNLRWEDFVGGVQDLPSGGGSSATIDNIAYTLTTGAQTGTGTSTTQLWTLAWTDTNGATEPNLPVYVDFVLDWKGGNFDVFYLFTDVLLPISPSSGSGTIEVKVTNPPGTSDLGTSHLDVLLSNTRPGGDVPPSQIPEPSTVALIALGMLLAAGVQRAKQTRS
jgi:PEP-CTERM motif-containing protein